MIEDEVEKSMLVIRSAIQCSGYMVSELSMNLLRSGLCFSCGEPITKYDFLAFGVVSCGRLLPAVDRDRTREDPHALPPVAVLAHSNDQCFGPHEGMFKMIVNHVIESKEDDMIRSLRDKRWSCALYEESLRACFSLRGQIYALEEWHRVVSDQVLRDHRGKDPEMG